MDPYIESSTSRDSLPVGPQSRPNMIEVVASLEHLHQSEDNEENHNVGLNSMNLACTISCKSTRIYLHEYISAYEVFIYIYIKGNSKKWYILKYKNKKIIN